MGEQHQKLGYEPIILATSLKLHGIETRMHFSRMRTARYLPYKGLCPEGVSVWVVSVRENLQTETCWKEHGTRDRDPLEGTWDQAARQGVTSYKDPFPMWTE